MNQPGRFLKRFSNVMGVALLALGVVAATLALTKSWGVFVQSCPNKDVLSSDGNARLSTVLDQYQAFHDLRLWDGIFPLLDTPTWPPLRYILSLIVFAVLPGGPSQIADTAISFAFYALLFPSLLFVSLRMCRSLLTAGLTFTAATLLIVQAAEIPMFALSSMLETQGMFFTAWSVYFTWRLWREDKHEPTSTPDALGLFLSIQGLYHTKYPYGIMFLLAAFAGEMIRHPRFYVDTADLALSTHYRGMRRLLLALFILVIAALAVAPHMGLPINNKTSKHVMFAVSLLFFIDANLFLLRRRSALGAPESTAALYKFGAFPALVWLLIHPDRLASTLGTQLRLQEQTRSYLASLLDQVFDSRPPAPLLGAAVVLALALLFLKRNRRDPGNILAAAAWALAFSQILILEFLTGNKQLRHIYHALPVVLVLSGVFVTHVRGVMQYVGGGILALIIVLAVTHPNSVLSQGYALKQMCFTDTDHALMDPARWVADKTPGGRVLIVNVFHPIMEPLKGRLLATDMDLLIRFKAREIGGWARNDSPHNDRTWSDFDAVLFVAPDCSPKAAAVTIEQRAKKVKAGLVEVRRFTHPAERICTVEYKILK
ncbi:MAG: hypothetical protein HY042_11445 [Spirochaetia bacterium]|nr:hypothetical protein [Spirochaetia bacterium]